MYNNKNVIILQVKLERFAPTQYPSRIYDWNVEIWVFRILILKNME